jgi:hypothetical protein
MINVNSSPNTGNNVPLINIDPPMIQIDADSGSSSRNQRFENNHDNVQVFEVPGVSVSGPDFEDHNHHGGPNINISGPDDYSGVHRGQGHGQPQQQQYPSSSQSHMVHQRPPGGGGGLICGGCGGPIVGRIVSAMGSRYHPACFKCTVCNALLEHVSSYEHEGQPYCHLDYHEVSACFLFFCSFWHIVNTWLNRILLPNVTLAKPPLLRNSLSVWTIRRLERGRITHNTFSVLNVVIHSFLRRVRFPQMRKVRELCFLSCRLLKKKKLL